MPEVQVLIFVGVIILVMAALLALFFMFTFDPDYNYRGSYVFAKGIVVGACAAFFTSSIFIFLTIKLLGGVEV